MNENLQELLTEDNIQTINDVHNMDVIDFLKSQPDSSAQVIIADPPYNIGFDGGKGWDTYPDEKTYLSWCQKWSEECARVLKPEGMLVVWGTLKTDTFLRYKLDVLNNLDGLSSQGEIIWENNWGGRTKSNFGRKHEYAWLYSKGDKFLFNKDDVLAERKQKTNPRTGKPYENGTIPTRVFIANNHTMSKDFVGWHPTTKNLKIIETIIRAYSNPGDTVLDIFSGSGTTTISAIRSGRNSQGCELDKDYWEKIQKRIETEKQVT